MSSSEVKRWPYLATSRIQLLEQLLNAYEESDTAAIEEVGLRLTANELRLQRLREQERQRRDTNE